MDYRGLFWQHVNIVTLTWAGILKYANIFILKSSFFFQICIMSISLTLHSKTKLKMNSVLKCYFEQYIVCSATKRYESIWVIKVIYIEVILWQVNLCLQIYQDKPGVVTLIYFKTEWHIQLV